MKLLNALTAAGLSALTVFSLSTAARADDPTTADCLGANDKSIALKGTPLQSGGAPAAADVGSAGDTQRLIGWVLTGAGVVGLGLGVVFEVQRSGKLNDADAVCPSGINCAPGSQNQINAFNDDAKSASTLAAVSFVAGGLLVAGGLAAVFTAPKAQSAQGFHDSSKVAVLPVVLPDFRGVSVVGKCW